MEITDKKFFQSVVSVIDYIQEGNREICCAKGCELSGNYWPAVRELFKSEHCASLYEGGDMYITRPHMLSPIYEASRAIISEIEKAEQDRDLSNQEKIENIRYGKKAYDLAADTAKWNKRSILFTGIVALGQLIQWIILIIQELSTP